MKLTTIKLVLSISIAENLHLELLNVKTMFLHGDLDKNMQGIKREGFQVPRKENIFWKLKKSLYGLK